MNLQNVGKLINRNVISETEFFEILGYFNELFSNALCSVVLAVLNRAELCSLCSRRCSRPGRARSGRRA
jgi:hypothetical protein